MSTPYLVELAKTTDKIHDTNIRSPVSSNECRTSSIQVQNHLSALAQTQSPAPCKDKARVTSQSLDTPSSPGNKSGVTTFVYGSTAVCADWLTEICQTMHKRFTIKGGALVIPTHRTNWVQSRMHGLLRDIFDDRVEGCDSFALPPPPQTNQGGHFLTTLTPANRTPSEPLARSTLLFFLKRISLVEAASFEWLGRNSDDGHGRNHDVSLTLDTYQPPGSPNSGAVESFTRCRLYVALTPKPDRQLQGVIVQFSEISGAQSQLWRTLTTFGIHQRDSQVFGHIRRGDVEAVQRLLALRLIVPNDRDEEGNSLLWVRHPICDGTQ